MLLHYRIDSIGKATLVKPHARITPTGKISFVQEYQRTEPKFLSKIDLTDVYQVDTALDKLERILKRVAPNNTELVHRTVRHYFGNYLSSLMTFQKLLRLKMIDENRYNDLVDNLQEKHQDLFGKVKEAIMKKQLGTYIDNEQIYEIKQSRRSW